MKLDFEYGHGTMTAELPDTTDVFIPGETIPDPPCIPGGSDRSQNTGIHTQSYGNETAFRAGS